MEAQAPVAITGCACDEGRIETPGSYFASYEKKGTRPATAAEIRFTSL